MTLNRQLTETRETLAQFQNEKIQEEYRRTFNETECVVTESIEKNAAWRERDTSSSEEDKYDNDFGSDRSI
jgi:hypothetical protein